MKYNNKSPTLFLDYLKFNKKVRLDEIYGKTNRSCKTV